MQFASLCYRTLRGFSRNAYGLSERAASNELDGIFPRTGLCGMQEEK